MDAIRVRLYGTAWLVYFVLIAAMMVLRRTLPERLPTRFLEDGTAAGWTERDSFIITFFTILGLILFFSILIDRFLLRKLGENAFLAAVTLFLTLLFLLALMPPVLHALDIPHIPILTLSVAGCLTVLLILAYLLRMRTLRKEDEEVKRTSDYFRKLKPTGLMAWIPVSYPFFPYTISLNDQGLLLRGALLASRWGWSQIEAVKPGKAHQAYGGAAIRLAVSGLDVILLTLKGVKWPLVANAPDRDLFLEAVRRHAPSIEIQLEA